MTQAAGRTIDVCTDPNKLDEARQRVDHLIEQNRVVLFMEGDRVAAQCTHSAQAVRLLEQHQVAFTAVDVLADPVLAQVLADKTRWVSFPQLFVERRFVGGCEALVALEQLSKLSQLLAGEPAGEPPAADPAP